MSQMNRGKMSIKKEADRVERILKSDARSRDSDLRLLAIIWYEQIVARDGKPQNDYELSKREGILEFLTLLQNDGLASPKTITRCRRKLQQHNESLQGRFYGKRKEKAKKVKQEMLDLDWHGRG